MWSRSSVLVNEVCSVTTGCLQSLSVSTAGRFIWIYINMIHPGHFCTEQRGFSWARECKSCFFSKLHCLSTDNPEVLPAEYKIMFWLIFPINLSASKIGVYSSMNCGNKSSIFLSICSASESFYLPKVLTAGSTASLLTQKRLTLLNIKKTPNPLSWCYESALF